MRLLLVLLLASSSFAHAKTIDPKDDHTRSLWTESRLKAVIYVRSSTRGPGQEAAYFKGTAFMVSDDYALTAAHVVCNEKTRQQYAQIELSVGGPGAGGPVAPMVVSCYENGADIAVMRLPGVNTGRNHLTPGSWNSLKTDPFVTTYGYGGDQQGRPLHASSHARLDDSNRLRAGFLAAPGDSGAPVLDRNGVVVGVLSAGNPTTVAIVPVLPLNDLLQKMNVPFAAPTEVRATTLPAAATAPAPGAKAVQGHVRIYSGPVDGKWPSPPWRAATADEATVLFTMRRSPVESTSAATDSAGAWSVPLNAPLGKGIDYAAVVTLASDLNQNSDAYQFLADPMYGKLTAATVDRPISMDVYARPAYVGRKYSTAQQKAAVQRESPEWRACAVRFGNRSAKAASCSDATLQTAADLVTQADADYERALNASLGTEDFELSTRIGANWSGFKLATSRPCEAVMIMKTVADRSSTRLFPPFLGQTLNMIGGCHGLPTSTPAAAMPWRAAEETRQVAAVRLMTELLQRYAADAAALRPVRKHVVLELLNAFERHKAGTIKAVEAAKTIKENDVLFRHLNQFTSNFFNPLCGRTNTLPRRSTEDISRTLVALRAQVADCAQ